MVNLLQTYAILTVNHGKPIVNLWNTHAMVNYGKPIVNLWNTYGEQRKTCCKPLAYPWETKANLL